MTAMRRLLFVVAVVSACSSPQTPPPLPAPAPRAAEPSPPPPHDEARALTLVGEAQEILKTRGEDGASDAIPRLLSALEADPNCHSARWELGWAYQLAGD